MSEPINNLSILVVDDDPATLRLHGAILQKAGYRIITAKDGREGLQRILSDGPLMVLTDWSMPEMDGLELCRAIRVHEAIPFAYIIILTAHDAKAEQVAEAFEAGVDDYISKPVTSRALLARIRAGERIVKLHQSNEHRNRELHRANAEMAITHYKLGEANSKLQKMVVTDELTGLFNRREAMNRISTAWAASTRRQTPMACIAIDIDRFKSCNDTYGHAVGDAVLKSVAKTLASTARVEESVCRLGGEEFLVICPQGTVHDAFLAAERLRTAIEKTTVPAMGLELNVTISLGVAQRTDRMRGSEEMLRAADEALYEAKKTGRNRTCAVPSGSVAEPSSPKSAAPKAERPRPSGAEISGRALVVSLDAEVSKDYGRRIEEQGFRTVVPAELEEIVEILNRTPPEVIVFCAEGGGEEQLPILMELKARAALHHIPILVITGIEDVDELGSVLDAGADELLSVPVNPRKLGWRIRSMIKMQKELSSINEARGAQSRALGILSEFTGIIATSASLDSILERMMAAIAELTGCRRIAALMSNPNEPVLSVAHDMGLLDITAQAVRVPISESIVGQVFESRVPIVLDTPSELAECAGKADEPLLCSLPTLVLPLCSADASVGVAVISGRGDQRSFSALELEYARLICGIAAACLADCLNRQARDDAYESIVIGLAKLAEHRDSDTGKHLDRVTQFSLVLAEELRRVDPYEHIINDEFLRDLRRSVPLHDIGKVAVPDQILRKPGALTDGEMKIMQTHALIGAKTLRSLVDRAPGTRFLKMAEQIAGGHHEWFNGRGYPLGLRGAAISLVARIVTVADVYDAITTKRPYKEAMPHDRAAAIILERSGTQFDPAVVDAFVRCEERFKQLAKDLADELGGTDRVRMSPAPPPALVASGS